MVKNLVKMSQNHLKIKSFQLTNIGILAESSAVHSNAREHSEGFFNARFEIFQLEDVSHGYWSIRRSKNPIKLF